MTGHGPWAVTVECPQEKIAFRFDAPTPLRVGSWIKLEGSYRFDPGVRSDGAPLERNAPYYHCPHDGTDVCDWEYRQMSDCKYFQVGPPELTTAIHAANLCLRRHQDSWESNLGLDCFQETAASLRAVLRLINEEIEERKPKPIASVGDISDLDL